MADSYAWRSSMTGSQRHHTFFCESFRIPTMNKYNDLISFLAVAQHLNIEWLNERWDRDIDPVGHGANAEVRTRSVSTKTGLVFKSHRALEVLRNRSAAPVYSDHGRKGKDKVCEEIYNGLVAEITVLAHPVIQHHPNIVHLEGLGWDVSSDHDEVWPVLILEKANRGDLWKFHRSTEGLQLAIKDRLLLCLDIASALCALHENEIVHGDIKPQNVLIFQETKGEDLGLFFAKLADFGYAGWSMDPLAEQPIYLPLSEPWNPPEHHHRGFRIDQVKKCDIYSFGLLCFWLLFHDRTIHEEQKPLEISESATTNPLFTQLNAKNLLNMVNEIKHTDNLPTLIHEIVSNTALPSLSDQVSLEEFFVHSLARDPNDRKICIQSLSAVTGQLCITGPKNQTPDHVNLDHSCVTFSIAEHYIPLLHSHYRVAQSVSSCLEHQASHAINKSSRKNAAFQCAVCCMIGLGRPASEVDSKYWLAISERSNLELMSEISLLKKHLKYRPYHRNGSVKLMEDDGLVSSTLDRWHYDENISTEVLHREIQDFERIFGSDNFVFLGLTTGLVRLFIAQGKLQDAETQFLQLVGKLTDNPSWETHLGSDTPWVIREQENYARDKIDPLVLSVPAPVNHLPEIQKLLTLLSRSFSHLALHLARLYRAQKRWNEAESLLIETRVSHVSNHTEFGAESIRVTQELARLYFEVGRYSEAEHVRKYLCDFNNRFYGKTHPDTLVSELELARTYVKLAQFEAAEILLSSLDAEYTHIYGPSTWRHQAIWTELAQCYRSNGRLKDAEDMSRHLISHCTKLFGASDEMVTELNNLAISLPQDSLKESEMLLQKALELNSSLGLSPVNDDGLLESNLGHIIQRQGNDDTAQVLFQRVLDRKYPFPEPDYVFNAAFGLSIIYKRRKQYHNMEQIFRLRIEEDRALHRDDHPTLIPWKNELVVIYMNSDRYEEAESLQTTLLKSLYRYLSTDYATCVTQTMRLIDIKMELKEYAAAHALIRDKIDMLRKMTSLTNRQTIDIAYLTTRSLVCQHQWKAADDASTAYLETLKDSGTLGWDREVANTYRARVLVRQHQWLEAAPYVVGSFSYFNLDYKSKYCYFKVVKVKGRLVVDRTDLFTSTVYLVVAVILFFGYWSGLYLFLSALASSIEKVTLEWERLQRRRSRTIHLE